MTDKRHEALWAACKKLPLDYTPYGKLKRWEDPKKVPYYPDCSGGCRFFLPLHNQGEADADWGVCANPKSHRYGLLTFEHQGCLEFRDKPRSKGD